MIYRLTGVKIINASYWPLVFSLRMQNWVLQLVIMPEFVWGFFHYSLSSEINSSKIDGLHKLLCKQQLGHTAMRVITVIFHSHFIISHKGQHRTWVSVIREKIITIKLPKNKIKSITSTGLHNKCLMSLFICTIK